MRVGPPLDLASLESVRRFAAAWDAEQRPLHILVNNAGTNYIHEEYTPEGVAILAQVRETSAPRQSAVFAFPLHLASVPSLCCACVRWKDGQAMQTLRIAVVPVHADSALCLHWSSQRMAT